MLIFFFFCNHGLLLTITQLPIGRSDLFRFFTIILDLQPFCRENGWNGIKMYKQRNFGLDNFETKTM